MTASRLFIPPEALAQIEREARGAFPSECCGLLEGVCADDMLRILAAHPTRNLSLEPDRFEIDPRDQIRLMRELRGTGREVVGCYHSHPNGREEPSPRDLQSAAEPGFVWLIAAVDAGGPVKIRVFAFTGSRFEPLLVRGSVESPISPAAS